MTIVETEAPVSSMTTAEIDAKIRRYPWMDFQIESLSEQRLVVQGYIFPAFGPCVRLTFRDVAFVESATAWRTDT